MELQKVLMSYEIRMNNKVGVAYGTATEEKILTE